MIVNAPKVLTNALGARYVVVHAGGERIVVTLPREG